MKHGKSGQSCSRLPAFQLAPYYYGKQQYAFYHPQTRDNRGDLIFNGTRTYSEPADGGQVNLIAVWGLADIVIESTMFATIWVQVYIAQFSDS
jgi:hypothetical protein